MAGERAEAGRRRGRGFAHAGALMRQSLVEAAASRGFAEPDVLIRWDAIMGAHLAALCRPVAVRYGRRGGLGATLVVRAPGARATEIEHLAPEILDRVNAHYGYRAVSRLRIEQEGAAPAGLAEEAEPFAPAPRPGSRRQPGADHLRAAERLAEGVADPDLRRALARLGAHVLANAGPTGTGAVPVEEPEGGAAPDRPDTAERRRER